MEFFVKAVRGKTKPKLEEKTVFWVLGLVKQLLVMMNKSKTRKKRSRYKEPIKKAAFHS